MGKWNGYGMGQTHTKRTCFNSQEEVRQKVENWIKDKIDQGWEVGTITCYYNTGIKQNDCEYYKKYLTIK